MSAERTKMKLSEALLTMIDGKEVCSRNIGEHIYLCIVDGRLFNQDKEMVKYDINFLMACDFELYKELKIEVGKCYKTRDGQKVRVYATDGEGAYTIHGAYHDGNGWVLGQWQPDGRIYFSDHREFVKSIESEWIEPEETIENLEKYSTLEETVQFYGTENKRFNSEDYLPPKETPDTYLVHDIWEKHPDAKWIAMDIDGDWFAYTAPVFDGDEWHNLEFMLDEQDYPKYSGKPEDSLLKRPEGI